MFISSVDRALLVLEQPYDAGQGKPRASHRTGLMTGESPPSDGVRGA